MKRARAGAGAHWRGVRTERRTRTKKGVESGRRPSLPGAARGGARGVGSVCAHARVHTRGEGVVAQGVCARAPCGGRGGRLARFRVCALELLFARGPLARSHSLCFFARLPAAHPTPTHSRACRARARTHTQARHTPMFALSPLAAPARAAGGCRARPGAALIECAHKKGSGSVKNGRDSRSRVSCRREGGAGGGRVVCVRAPTLSRGREGRAVVAPGGGEGPGGGPAATRVRGVPLASLPPSSSRPAVPPKHPTSPPLFPHSVTVSRCMAASPSRRAASSSASWARR